jgi:hypothetical protein
MHLANCTIQQIRLTAHTPAGELVAVVICDNGQLAITRNGVPIPGIGWEPGEVEQCVTELMRLTGLGTQE